MVKNNDNTITLFIDVEEGDEYSFGKIDFLGNTVYSDEQLKRVLRIDSGDVYNGVELRKRIADGAGVQIRDVNLLIKQFSQMQKMMRKMKGGKMKQLMNAFGGGGGGLPDLEGMDPKQLAKLANQAIVGVTIGAVAEAMLLLEAGGADPAAVRDALRGGFADGTILQQHGARMTERDFTPGGPAKIQLKDLNNVLVEANDLGLTLPVTKHIRDRFHNYVDHMNGADTDHSGLYLELISQNGLKKEP